MITGMISGDRISPVASTRATAGNRASPSAASTPSTVDIATTVTATSTLNQVAAIQSRLPRYSRYQRTPNAGGGNVKYPAEENDSTITTTIGAIITTRMHATTTRIRVWPILIGSRARVPGGPRRRTGTPPSSPA